MTNTKMDKASIGNLIKSHKYTFTSFEESLVSKILH